MVLSHVRFRTDRYVIPLLGMTSQQLEHYTPRIVVVLTSEYLRLGLGLSIQKVTAIFPNVLGLG